MSRLISLTVTDFKRIRAARIPIKDGLNKIVGANGQGKTSLLDALAALLSGKEIPEDPIRTGAESASIVGEFNDMVLTRRITKTANTLVITSKDGTSKFSKPQDMLDRLTGGTGARLFDPSKFIKETDTPDGRRSQAEQLRKLVGLDFTEMDQQRAALFSQRTAANSAASDAESYANGLPAFEGVPEAEESAGAILSEIDKATEHNRNIQTKADEVANAKKAVSDHAGKITDYQKKVDDLKLQLSSAEATLKSAKMAALDLDDTVETKVKEHGAMVAIDPAPIRARLDALESTNGKVRANAAKKKAIADSATKAAKAKDLTSKIDKIDAEKQKAMTEAKFPIEGLSFDENGVRFAGKPFTQASDAEKLRVAVAVYAARNPEIKAMILRLGSLLDDNSLALLEELAEKYQLQVLLEIVQHGDEDAPAGAIVIEDGTVKAP